MCTGAIIVLVKSVVIKNKSVFVHVFYSTHYSFKLKDGENLLSLALMHGSPKGKSNKAET